MGFVNIREKITFLEVGVCVCGVCVRACVRVCVCVCVCKCKCGLLVLCTSGAHQGEARTPYTREGGT